MKAPVGGIIIFGLAPGAHFKMLHRCLGPIVGDVVNDGVAGAAIGAIDERIAKTAILRIEHLSSAVIADGHIRRNQGGHGRIAFALYDREFCVAVNRCLLVGYFDDISQGRVFGGEICGKTVNVVCKAFDVNDDTRRCVGHLPFQVVPVCKIVNKGAKSHPLNNSVYRKLSGNSVFGHVC
jgi:hypothetical protein